MERKIETQPTLSHGIHRERRRCIVIVDDDDSIRCLCVRALSRYYDAIGCNSASAALNVIAARYVDLVLSDLQMPDRTGYELKQDLQSRYPDLPVVLMTGMFTPDPRRQEIERQGCNVLSKPFTLEQLEAFIQRHVGTDPHPRR